MIKNLHAIEKLLIVRPIKGDIIIGCSIIIIIIMIAIKWSRGPCAVIDHSRGFK